ncbi:hypothetical protein [Dyadobacter alkalitolerans]|uniref:hypothetical protein n=1 Tax=Dyadobacter alkalitolerans TaxID=492736 RepID=UPI0004104FFE|nr:hypothetical protein [Dyadobacter alkalitolerans]
MKNEDLSYKIRELLDRSDESDPEWDPDKFWNLFEARKRRRQRWVTFSYSMAAAVVLVAVSIVFSGDGLIRYNGTNSKKVSKVQGNLTHPLLKSERELSLHENSEANTRHNGRLTASTKRAPYPAYAKMKPSKRSAAQTGVYFKKASPPVDEPYPDDPYMEQSAAIFSQENDDMPSLLRMFEQARKERELRTLSVQLEDRENYNSFWLTVNQQLLANKLNSDQLHYERY